ncbi:hypothetical protein ACFLVB_05375 [Chloroflexota bacterium]
MILNTCSSAISLARELENKAADFYENLSQRYARGADIFLSFAKENRKSITRTEMVYHGVISDALEGCFAFNLNPDDYKFENGLSDKSNYADVIEQAIEIEGKVTKFYSDAAEQSDTLLADIPAAFTLIVKKRASRIETLRVLCQSPD